MLTRFQPLALILAVLAAALAAAAQSSSSPRQNGDSALCRLVYRVDDFPSSRGYRYTFYGNAFFISEEGYLLTVAHVLEGFRDGGQPYILVNRLDSPPRLLAVTVVASDPAYDVAVLRASPNPFAGRFQVTFLPLASTPPLPGDSVLALSLHPRKPRNAHTFEAPAEDRSPGHVLTYQSTQLDPSASTAEVLLLTHSVDKGQSGSPVLTLNADSSPAGVVGLIEGRWLRSATPGSNNLPAGDSVSPTSAAVDSVPGAAIPIRHAIDLLKRHNIAYHTSP